MIQKPDQTHPLIILTTLDDGLRSVSAFVRWLEQYAPLFRSLRRAEVIYAADNSRNFDEAEREFLRRFPRQVESNELPRGVDHFLSYLRLRTRYDRECGGFSADYMRILREAMDRYTSLEQQALLSAWKIGSTTEEKIRAGFERETSHLSIRGYLLEYDYPSSMWAACMGLYGVRRVHNSLLVKPTRVSTTEQSLGYDLSGRQGFNPLSVSI